VQRRPQRSRRALTLVKLAAATVAVLALLAVAFPLRFIGVHCYAKRNQPIARSLELLRATTDVRGYFREEAPTFLTLPEWYVVYSAEEYARFIESRPPSQFPYVGAIHQYWSYYADVCRATKGFYRFDTGVHLMLGVIGTSFSAENAVRGAYERTVGRFTELIGGYHTEEDAFARRTAREYGAFIHTVPWYEFPFASKLKALWRETPLVGRGLVRKWERRLALTAEYGTKAAYGWMIARSTGAVYAAEELVIHAWVENAPERIFDDERVRRVRAVDTGSYLVMLPRYEPFTEVVEMLVKQGVRFRDFAGNETIVLTAIAPRAWDYRLPSGEVVLSATILTSPAAKRIAVKAPVASLHAILAGLENHGVTLEHLYDY
jgi:hypothetical protein